MRRVIRRISAIAFKLAVSGSVLGLLLFAAGIITVTLAPAGLWNISPGSFTALYTGLWLMLWSAIATVVSLVVASVAEFV